MTDSLQAAIDQINDCKYLDVGPVEIIEGYGVRLVVDELIPQRNFPENPERDYVPELAAKIRAAITAEAIYEFRSFEIIFDEIICYLISNESYGKYPEAPESFTGKLFRVFSWSYLLEMTKKTSYASDELPGPEHLMHFQICGQDDIVDIIASVYPVINISKARQSS